MGEAQLITTRATVSSCCLMTDSLVIDVLGSRETRLMEKPNQPLNSHKTQVEMMRKSKVEVR